MIYPSLEARASWQPFTFITPVVAGTGSLTNQPIFTAPQSGYFVVSVYMSPSTSVVASTSTLTINFIEAGQARSITGTQLSLFGMSTAVSNYFMIKADSQTPVTFSVVTVGAGAYNLHVGWKPQGS